MASEMDGALRRRLEDLARQVSERWPVQSDGVCRFCGCVAHIPSPRSSKYDAAEMLTSHEHHSPSCPWVKAREIVKLLG